MSLPISWLHLSDFHFGRSYGGQKEILDYILEQVANKIRDRMPPDIILLSGDIANRGLPDEYERFIEEFYFPLQEALGHSWAGRIYIVPGNHDVDRTKAVNFQAHEILKTSGNFLDPTDEGLSMRQILRSRFEAFMRADLPDAGGDWLFSKTGAFTEILKIRGRRVGVLGINTAWLSENERDRKSLTPGRGIVEKGMAFLKDCDVRLVLGHHPLDYFDNEEVAGIRALFKRDNVIYLHGHLHENPSGCDLKESRDLLALQAGASFKVSPGDLWVNRMLWCELDLEAQQLLVEVLPYDKDGERGGLDESIFPAELKTGTNRWALPLSPAQPLNVQTAPASRLMTPLANLPVGWVEVNDEYLAFYRRAELSEPLLLKYFDGSIPEWSEALSPKIPRRAIVKRLKDELDKPSDGLPSVQLLLGPGGEGKSTALLQAAYDMADINSGWRVIWRTSQNVGLPVDFVLNLPRSDEKWLIVSDDADRIASDVYEAVQSLKSARRDDVHFLLCSRETDWRFVGAMDETWDKFSSYNPIELRGLTKDDALEIVKAWDRVSGLGALAALGDIEAAARDLLKKAQSQVDDEDYHDEGAFIGAMLLARMGKGMKAHVKGLLNSFREEAAPGPDGTLLHAFSYIAAMHAENQFILSREVLAAALSCKPREVSNNIVKRLGKEAAANNESHCILTRHRTIAEEAVEILSDEMSFDDIFVELVLAAQDVFDSDPMNLYKPGDWKFLSSYFFKKGKNKGKGKAANDDKSSRRYRELGVRLATELFRHKPQDPNLLNKLAEILRDDDKPEESVQLFHNSLVEPRKDRSFYFEWAISEGQCRRLNLTAWLAGVSIADSPVMGNLKFERSLYSMNGLAYSFADLSATDDDLTFIKACGAAAQLGLMMADKLPQGRIREEGELFLKRNQQESKRANITDVEPSVAFERLRSGIVKAWERREVELPIWVARGDTLTFSKLKGLLGVAKG
jgi:predicted phosphodiesterase